MSAKGNCYDNAAMGSFWATLKTECFQNQIPRNREHAQVLLFQERMTEKPFPNV
jgi:putative transposase